MAESPIARTLAMKLPLRRPGTIANERGVGLVVISAFSVAPGMLATNCQPSARYFTLLRGSTSSLVASQRKYDEPEAMPTNHQIRLPWRR